MKKFFHNFFIFKILKRFEILHVFSHNHRHNSMAFITGFDTCWIIWMNLMIDHVAHFIEISPLILIIFFFSSTLYNEEKALQMCLIKIAFFLFHFFLRLLQFLCGNPNLCLFFLSYNFVSIFEIKLSFSKNTKLQWKWKEENKESKNLNGFSKHFVTICLYRNCVT